jgi:hypothetical protein
MSNIPPGPWRIGFNDGSGLNYITTVAEHPIRHGGMLPTVIIGGCEDSYGIPQGVHNPAVAQVIVKIPEILELLDAIAESGDLRASLHRRTYRLLRQMRDVPCPIPSPT